MIRFMIPGEATPQARPKFARMGNHVKAYDPERCRNYKAFVRLVAISVAPAIPIEGACEVAIVIHKSIPKTWSKKKTSEALTGVLRPITKPDLDNTAKGILDALKGLLWGDDSQIVSLTVQKFYSDQPRVEMTISEVVR